MTVKERIISLRLISKLQKNPKYANEIGISKKEHFIQPQNSSSFNYQKS